jgi:hypothetical protein
MQDRPFSINIAAIPWNWRRTSSEMAALINASEGRFSVSVHGCDHTADEFGSSSYPEIEAKVNLVRWRMGRHRLRTGICQDPIMVFPQGVFSRESMQVLQRHGFTAVVNTDLSPLHGNERPVTVEEAWSPCILRYGGFPLFPRRYPGDGIENFAFDLLLGKPCLIVEHHEFFREAGDALLNFVDKLNALNHPLRWRSLIDVIKRSCQVRKTGDAIMDARIFTNQAVLASSTKSEQKYRVQMHLGAKAAGLKVLVNGEELVEYEETADWLTFQCGASGGVCAIESHRPVPAITPVRCSIRTSSKVAVRRLLSEFRDNCLCRHESLLRLANQVRGVQSLAT